MNCRTVCATLIVVALSATAAAQDPRQRSIEVQQMKDNLYVLKGGGGNTTVFVTATGVVVVDSKEQGWGQPIIDAIKSITDKPITTLINTGPDLDHVGGNAEFPADVQIIAQRNTKKRMAKAGLVGHALPARTFRNSMKLFSGADEVDLYCFGAGHTDGDTWVFFPALGVVHAGDIFPGDDLPVLDAKNGGSALRIGETLDSGYRKLKRATLVITGHGAERTWQDLKEYTAFNNKFIDDMWIARRDRRSVDDVARDWSIPASYQKYAPVDADRLKKNVALAFKELNEEARVGAAVRQPLYGDDSYVGTRSPAETAPAASPAPAPEPPPPAPSEGSP